MGWLVEHRPELVLTDSALTESGGGIPLGQGAAEHVTVTTGQKGAAARRVRLRGGSGHGSMPYGIVSGARLAADVVTRIAAHRTAPAVPTDQWWPDLLSALGHTPDLVERLCNAETIDDALPETGEMARVLHALTHLTLSPNVIAAGSKTNVIPGEGIVDLDIRLLPGQTGADADAELAAALAGIAGEITVEAGHEASALETDRSDPLYGVLRDVIEEFYPGAGALPMLTPGGNDARHYLSRGLPCYGFGMFSPEMDIASFRARFHGDDERIDLASVRLAAAAYRRIAERFLGY
jgi:acetylornithine deacetylase/succinyl-diaminopimelate desuccinylase-like protein